MPDQPDGSEPIVLTPEQRAQVLEALHAKEAGEPSYTAEEVLEFARSQVKARLPDKSA